MQNALKEYRAKCNATKGMGETVLQVRPPWGFQPSPPDTCQMLYQLTYLALTIEHL